MISLSPVTHMSKAINGGRLSLLTSTPTSIYNKYIVDIKCLYKSYHPDQCNTCILYILHCMYVLYVVTDCIENKTQ